MAGSVAIKIASLPNDGNKWLVVAYGAVRKRQDFISNPQVEVLLLKLGETPSFSQTVLLGITELDIVRIGTVWKDQKYVETINKGIRHSVVDEFFQFDLRRNPPKVIEFRDKNPITDEYYIPYDDFHLPPEKEQDINYKRFSYLKSKFNVLTTKDGKQVLISAMETLTSLYTPSRKDIRRLVLTRSYDIEAILKNYLTDFEFDNPSFLGYSVTLKPNAELSAAPIIFLAHLALNPDTQNVVKHISSSLENAELNQDGKPYVNRHPEILPYHSDKLWFSASGLWIGKNKDRFLVLRGNSVWAPSEVKVMATVPEKVSPDNDDLINAGQKRSQRTLVEAREAIVRNDTDPSTGAGMTYVVSEVRSYVEPGVIQHKKDLIDANSGQSVANMGLKEKLVDQVNASSGEAFGKDSDVATLENTEAKEQRRVDQLGAVKDVYDAISALTLNEETGVSEVYCLDSLANLVNGFYEIDIYELLKDEYLLYKGGSWLSKGTHRKIIIIKVVMNDGSYRYVVEVQRELSDDTFSGVYFTLDDDIDRHVVREIARLITRCQGKAKWIMDLYGVTGLRVFRHTKSRGGWVGRIHRMLLRRPKPV